MWAALNGPPDRRPRRMIARKAPAARRASVSALTRIAGTAARDEPASREIKVHSQFDRQRPQRAVEFALQRHGLEHAGQRVADAADQRGALPEVFICARGAEIVGDGQGGQRRGEDEDGQREHDPEARDRAQRPRPEEGNQAASIDQAGRSPESRWRQRTRRPPSRQPKARAGRRRPRDSPEVRERRHCG